MQSLGQATALSVALIGLDAQLVQVEVDSARGLSGFRMVGLPETAVRESQARIRAALGRLDVELNEYSLTVNLAPADLRKTGSCFDLAIATAVLAAIGKIDRERLAGVVLLGELSLSGELRPVRGVLPALIGAKRRGERYAIVPRDNAAEAGVIEPICSYAASHLREVVDHFNGERYLEQVSPPAPGTDALGPPTVDLSEVRGQAAGRRALEFAAAGGHNLLMSGPPGAGKTMLARRLPTLLPPMTSEEAMEATAVHSVAGLLHRDDGLLRHRPFRAPHHTISSVALLGGGNPLRPGEVSLAHLGCLFLDELFEFRRSVLEGLRQPLEEGAITICRAHGRTTFPARSMLVTAVNPCPCGYAGHPYRPCACTPEQIAAYQSRLSGPLLDRIDLHCVLPSVTLGELHSSAPGESSAEVAQRVVQVRALQQDRFRHGETRSPLNATLSLDDLDRVAKPSRSAVGLFRTAIDHLGLSARGYAKVRRVARTIADLEGVDAVRAGHFQEAFTFRGLSRSRPARKGRAAA